MDYKIMRLTGRCADGAERGSGTKWHAVANGAWQALCGAKPGRRSAGWSDLKFQTPTGMSGEAVTCPRCQTKLAKDADAKD